MLLNGGDYILVLLKWNNFSVIDWGFCVQTRQFCMFLNKKR